MSRFSRLVSLVLLALWLPATQHCALEAAGFIGSVCHTDRNTLEQSCANDACATFESALYQANPHVALVAPPPSHDCLLIELLSPPALPEPEVRLTSALDHPQDWVVVWHFVQRAAPPSRAPTFLA